MRILRLLREKGVERRSSHMRRCSSPGVSRISSHSSRPSLEEPLLVMFLGRQTGMLGYRRLAGLSFSCERVLLRDKFANRCGRQVGSIIEEEIQREYCYVASDGRDTYGVTFES